MKKSNDRIKNASLALLTNLEALRTTYRDPSGLCENLLRLHSTFTAFVSATNCVKPEEKAFIPKKSVENLQYYEYNYNICCVVVVHDTYGVISVDTGYEWLNNKVLVECQRKFETCKDLIVLYSDFGYRKCDICGKYGEGADVRISEVDYISAYHSLCYKNSNN
ncbi:hypothetical protein COBT_000783 [Conglomerata obtusa]